MRKIKVYTCGRCGAIPKASLKGEWFKIYCPVCHIGRSRHLSTAIDWEVDLWNKRAKKFNNDYSSAYKIEMVEIELKA